MLFVLAFLLLVVAPLLIVGDTVNKAIQQHNAVYRNNGGKQ